MFEECPNARDRIDTVASRSLGHDPRGVRRRNAVSAARAGPEEIDLSPLAGSPCGAAPVSRRPTASPVI
jgi:hypothetical protein